MNQSTAKDLIIVLQNQLSDLGRTVGQWLTEVICPEPGVGFGGEDSWQCLETSVIVTTLWEEEARCH